MGGRRYRFGLRVARPGQTSGRFCIDLKRCTRLSFAKSVVVKEVEVEKTVNGTSDGPRGSTILRDGPFGSGLLNPCHSASTTLSGHMQHRVQAKRQDMRSVWDG